MEAKADEILWSFQLSVDNGKRYNVMKNKFKTYFIKWKNSIFERAKFKESKTIQNQWKIFKQTFTHLLNTANTQIYMIK